MPGCAHHNCPCPTGSPCLRAYTRDPDAYDQALERCKPLRLHIVTAGPATTEPGCDNTLRCTCRACTSERARLIARGPIGAGPAQLKPRPARRRAA